MKIPKRSRSCDRCSRTFEPHEYYFTLLLPGEREEEWLRSDRCASCWEERTSAVRWQSAVPPSPPKERKSPLTVEERLLTYLSELVEGDGVGQVRAHLLALYLERLGTLVRTGRRKRKSGLWIDYSTRGGDPTFSILQVDVSRLSPSIQTALVADLRHLAEAEEDLDAPEPAPAAFEAFDQTAPPPSEERDKVMCDLCAPLDSPLNELTRVE